MMDTAGAARVVSGRMVGESVRFTRVTTDTRALAPGDLFVALKGERHDGHDYVPHAGSWMVESVFRREHRGLPRARHCGDPDVLEGRRHGLNQRARSRL